jgi:hypothetical protein
MNKIIEKIRRAFEDRKLAPKPTPSTKLARLEPTKKGAPRPAGEFRDRGRGNGARGGRGGGSRGGVDRRVDRDPNSIQCNICAQFGHGCLICPKGNKEMQKKEVARRAERDNAKETRNASRALRRAEGKDEEVSEDEDAYEDASEAGSSVNREHYSVGSVSFFIPSPTCTRTQPTAHQRTLSLHALNTARSLCTRKSTKIYPRPLHDPNPTLRLKVTGQ